MSEVCANVNMSVVLDTKEATELINSLNRSLEIIQAMQPFDIRGVDDSEIGDVFGRATIKIVETIALISTVAATIKCDGELL